MQEIKYKKIFKQYGINVYIRGLEPCYHSPHIHIGYKNKSYVFLFSNQQLIPPNHKMETLIKKILSKHKGLSEYLIYLYRIYNDC